MADNIVLSTNVGTGSTAWTDEVTGSKHAQIVKLADGTADSTTVIASGNGVAASALRVSIASDSTGIVSLTTSTASIGKLAANSGVDIGDVDITSIAAGDNNIGNVDIVTVPTDPFGANADAGSATGSISAKLRFIAATGIPITGTVTVGSHAVTNAGTFATQVDGTALTRLTDIETNTDYGAVVGNGAAATALRVTLANDSTGIVSLTTSTASIGKLAANSGVDIGDVDVGTISGQTIQFGNGASGTAVPRVTIANDSTGILAGVTTVTTVTTVSTLTGGNIAHDSADSGNPHKIGAVATASLLGQTPVTAADRTNLYAGTDGALLVRDGSSLEDVISDRATNTDGASTAMTGAFAATASQRIYLTDIALANSSASNITVDIRDGAAGAALWTFPVPANGGVVHSFKTPLRFTANTALAFDGSAAATTLTCSVSGFKSKT